MIEKHVRCVGEQDAQFGRCELLEVCWPAKYEAVARDNHPVLTMLLTEDKVGDGRASYHSGAVQTGYLPIGRIVLRPSDVSMHAVATPGRDVTGQMVMAHFDREAFESITRLRHWNADSLTRCNNVPSSAVARLMREMARELAMPGLHTCRAISALSELILVELARAFACPEKNQPESGLTTWQLRKIERCLRQTAEYWPSSQELATLCGVSAGHLSRGFHTATGTTLSSFASEIRMSRAKDLLVTNRLSLKQIAAQLGFSTPSSFSFAFRSHVGETPTAFRRRALSGD